MKPLEPLGVIYTSGGVWKIIEKSRDIHISLHNDGRQGKNVEISREFQESSCTYFVDRKCVGNSREFQRWKEPLWVLENFLGAYR